ncbi:MAG: Spy/CpxP family protein refolding chaperone [Gemmatimonadota bacterium]
MVNRKLAVFALVLLPSLMAAQGKGRMRGDKEADWDKITKEQGKGLQLSNKDVESTNPLRFLIDKRGDLKLTDAQLTQLKDIDAKVKGKNEPPFKTLDSIRTEMKPAARASEEDLPRMLNARAGLKAVLAEIKANYEEALNAALPILDDSQKKTAADMLKCQNDESEKMLREKLGGRG